MLQAIIRFSVRNKLIIGLFTLALVLTGVINLRQLPIDALPDITSNQVQVITTSPTLAAPEVEQLITFPIEQASARIPGIREMRSISRFGLSVVTIVFSDETDIYWARQQVNEQISLAREQIPAEAGKPELAPATTGLGEVYQYILRAAKGYENKYDLTELRSIQDWIVRRQLLGTPGVADVSSFGGNLKQYEVAIQPDRLKSMNVTVSDVFTAVQKNNQNSGGAYIEKGPTALFIRTEGLAGSMDDIRKMVVKYTPSGIPVLISDVAEVRIGHAIRYGAMTYKAEGEVAGAIVLMLKGANASQVVNSVKERIEQIRKNLPEGVLLESFYDRTKMVDNAISTVKKNLLEGALIVVFVLVLFLGNLRAGLIVASVIPLSMLFAVIMMNLFGVSGNLMSLGALDFGLIVDGAVIIVEAVLHRLTHLGLLPGKKSITPQELNSEVSGSAGKMMNSAVFGQVIILIVYLPILTLTGIEGKMFKPMAQTVSFALIGAFLLSVTYIPMISSLVLSRRVADKENLADRLMRRVQRVYARLLNGALRFPRLVVGAAVGLFVLALVLMQSLGGEFIPEMEEGDFAVDARLMTGSSLTETVHTTQKAVAILQNRFPEVEKIVTRIGAAEIPTDPMPVEMTDIMITLKPRSEWVSASSFDELANKMSEAIKQVPGMTAGFQFPVQMRFNELISGAKQDIVCKVFGDDLDSLAAFAGRIGSIAGTVNGAKDIYIESVTGLPQIVVRYDRNMMAAYQLTIEDVNRVIRTAFAGSSAGMVYEKERRYDLVVRLNKEDRNDISDVQQLLIPTPTGLQVPLYQVAQVAIEQGPNQIQRENAQRRVIVGFNVRGRDIESVVNELREKAGRQLRMPAGYFITYGGQFENLVEAKDRLAVALPAALLLILLMLYFAFGSVKYGLLIFSAIPLSAIGGVFALFARGMPFSISAGVGFIALFGVAVLNGIVLIAEFNRIKKQGVQDMKQIIIQGTTMRLRPVLMTAAVASLGFLPMAFSKGSGAEVQRPLATVVIGGLITATFLTLVVLPILYRWIETRRRKSSRKTITTLLLFLFVLTAGISRAQQAVPLDSMLRQAERQNLGLQGARKQSEYWKQLQEGVFDPPKMQMGAEYGNINSAVNDTRFLVSQSFQLPAVYNRQRVLYQAEETTQRQLAGWRKAELFRETKKLFYQLVELQERKKLLQELDSIYTETGKAASLRFSSGETNFLEKTNSEAQVLQLQVQSAQLDADILLTQRKLQWLLQTDRLLLPSYTSLKKTGEVMIDTSVSAPHPLVQYQQSLERTAAAQTNMEKAKRMPELGLGYSNQSITGYQSPDGLTQKYYGSGNRFHVFSFSVALPVFQSAAKARIRAGAVQESVARINTKIAEEQLKNAKWQLLAEWQKQHAVLKYYEQNGLRQAEQIIYNAGQNLRSGNLSYLEWTLLMNNAISIRINYLDAIKKYNESLIELEYLNEK
ncbi:CusA/CzcA family heavy metal efflux RND transporter [Sediminibacterium soli]|uniref:CusA/CzcA family heavy metal efflux RND transporter n=1 Tax=Sediminibacterium soli TaxID=2698829 RepID=UPI00137A62B8|nr:CusA/CzcA family heavy metal efflux RND transporter [Sediminibacterium soli]NCI45978.1 CusA/CzcA family heavy metal efflux RND transporter [Sediminibacterium soli]